MSADAKIQALFRSLEVEEKQLLKERAPIDEIIEQRTEVLEGLLDKKRGFLDKLEQGDRKLKSQSLRSGNIGALAEWERFAARLKKELAILEPDVKNAEKELESARRRLAEVDEELIAVRLERKKIERVIENREEKERIQTQALDEVSSDELSIYKNRKQ